MANQDPGSYKKIEGPLWGFVFAILSLAIIPTFVTKKWLEDWHQAFETIRNIGLGVAGILAATVGLWLAWRRTNAATGQTQAAIDRERREATHSRELLYTKMFTDAVGQLESKEILVRLGALYSLERIARESSKDHWPIMELLTAYIREEAPWPAKEESHANRSHPNADIQAIIQIIGRRNIAHETDAQWHDLNDTNLRGSDMNRLNFQRVSFRKSNLSGAGISESNLSPCRLQSADLSMALMRNSDFANSDCRKAKFEGAILTQSNFCSSELQQARFCKANLAGGKFDHSNLEGCHLDVANLAGASFQFCNCSGAMIGDEFALKMDANGIKQSITINGLPNVQGANFTGAIGLTPEQFVMTLWNETTVFPDGFDVDEFVRLTGDVESRLSVDREK